MNRQRVSLLAALVFATLPSCEKGKEKPSDPAPAAASVAVAVPAPPASAAAPAESESVPVAADFEEEAEKTITKANYKTELDALEAELKR
jgi:hypothetical protein